MVKVTHGLEVIATLGEIILVNVIIGAVFGIVLLLIADLYNRRKK